MPRQILSGAMWRKSSFSGGTDGGDCVEVAFGDRGVAVRDSKNPEGAMLEFTHSEWQAFVAGVKAREFDLPA